VVGATSINALPLGRGGWSFSFADSLAKAESNRDEESISAAVYMTDHTGLEATGLALTRGRYFQPEEIVEMTEGAQARAPVIVISDAMASKLFGDADPLGKPVYFSGDSDQSPAIVVGTVKQLQSPWTTWDDHEVTAILPMRFLFESRRYLIRTEPGQREAAMGQTEQLLASLDNNRIIHRMISYDEIRARGYREQRAMAWILGATMLGLSLVTALGIVGMASFWVTQRIKQIGTRRALGARRFDVRRYFQVENAMISLAGIALGVTLAWLLNVWLVSEMALPQLPLAYLPVAALAVFILGQLAVFGPARRASQVSPAVATRTV
jgi:putative ABC transport system permease protein